MAPNTAANSANASNSFFGILILVVTRIPESLRCGLRCREESHGDCGRDLGLVFAALGGIGTILRFVSGVVQSIEAGLETIASGAGDGIARSGASIGAIGLLMRLGGIACFAIVVSQVHGAASWLRGFERSTRSLMR